MGIPLFHSATVKSLLVGICCFKMCSINRLDLIVQCLLCFEKLLQWAILRKILLHKCHSINKVVLFQVSVWRHLCRTHICLENYCCITWQHSEQWTHHTYGAVGGEDDLPLMFPCRGVVTCQLHVITLWYRLAVWSLWRWCNLPENYFKASDLIPKKWLHFVFKCL